MQILFAILTLEKFLDSFGNLVLHCLIVAKIQLRGFPEELSGENSEGFYV